MLRRLSIGIDRVLYTAATDATFRTVLLCDRQVALRDWDIRLTSAEARILAAISQDALADMIDAVRPAEQGRRRFLQAVAAASAASVVVVEASGCVDTSKGIRPDTQDAEVVGLDSSADAAPVADAVVSEDATPNP